MNLRDKLRNGGNELPSNEGEADENQVIQANPKAAKNRDASTSMVAGLPKLDVNRRFLMIAGAAALMTALMGVMYLNNAGSGLAEGGTKVKVFTPKDDISPGTRLTEENTSTTEIPKAYLPKGAITDLEKLKDHVAIAPMVAGEPIIAARISAPDGKYGIAYLLKPGERAKTLTVDSASGLAGLIKPGNEIDLHATVPDPTDNGRLIGTTVLQKARVIAVGNHLLGELPKTEEDAAKESNSGISSENTVTLALPGEKVSIVTLMEAKGNLKLVLRANDDKTVSKPQFTDDVLMGLLGGKIPEKPAPSVEKTTKPIIHRDPPPVIHYDPTPRPVVHHVAPLPKPQPKPARPNEHKAPQQPQTNTPKQPEIIRFGGGSN